MHLSFYINELIIFPPNWSLSSHLTYSPHSLPSLLILSTLPPHVHSPPATVASLIFINTLLIFRLLDQPSIYQKGMLKPPTIKVELSISYFNYIRFYLNITINQVDLINIYRILHPTTVKIYTIFRSQRTFTNIDHILGHKYTLTKWKAKKSYEVYSKTIMKLN